MLILDDDEAFPLDGAMPAGFTTPVAATKGWHVSNDPGAFEGAYALKSDEIDDNEIHNAQDAFGRVWNVQVSPSWEDSHLVAKSGVKLSFWSYWTRKG